MNVRRYDIVTSIAQVEFIHTQLMRHVCVYSRLKYDCRICVVHIPFKPGIKQSSHPMRYQPRLHRNPAHVHTAGFDFRNQHVRHSHRHLNIGADIPVRSARSGQIASLIGRMAPIQGRIATKNSLQQDYSSAKVRGGVNQCILEGHTEKKLKLRCKRRRYLHVFRSVCFFATFPPISISVILHTN